MGCNQSRKERTLTEEEIKKLRQFHQKTANSYPETKGKDNLSVQAFRDIFAENVSFGEKLHEFMLKVSTTDRVDVELFVDVLELLIKKASNKKLSEAYSQYDRVTLLCMILFPHLRKSLEKEKDQANHMHSLITYSEALDFNLCVLHMLCGQPEQKINEAAARSIADRIFPTDDAKIEFWQFQLLVKEQIYLITTLINIYFKGKFLDGTVSFMMPIMPDYEKQTLIKQDQLTQLYINNNYLLNASELKLLYQAGSSNYKYASLAEALQGFSGETFIILKFEEGNNQYIIGGFSSQSWGKQTNETSSISDCYIFSLSPQYKHLFPVITNQPYGQKTQYCSLSMPNSYSRDSGIVFGSSKEEARLWIDSFSLQNCFVKNSDRYFKKGALIPQQAQKPVCTYIEAYGVATDLSKKNFSQSIIGQNRLTSMVGFRGDVRSSATTDITRPSLYKQISYSTQANGRNGQPYSTAQSVVVQQSVNPNYAPYSEDVVKRAAAPSNYPQYTQATSTSYVPNSSYTYAAKDNNTFQPSKSYTPSSQSYDYKQTSNTPLLTQDYLAQSYTVTSPSNPALNKPTLASSYEVSQKPNINIEDLIGKQNYQKWQESSANAPRSTLPAYTYSNSRSASPKNQIDYQGRNTTTATVQNYEKLTPFAPDSNQNFQKIDYQTGQIGVAK